LEKKWKKNIKLGMEELGYSFLKLEIEIKEDKLQKWLYMSFLLVITVVVLFINVTNGSGAEQLVPEKFVRLYIIYVEMYFLFFELIQNAIQVAGNWLAICYYALG
jgi:hypothetical protein